MVIQDSQVVEDGDVEGGGDGGGKARSSNHLGVQAAYIIAGLPRSARALQSFW